MSNIFGWKPAFYDQAMKFGTQHLQIVYIEIRNVAKVDGTCGPPFSGGYATQKPVF